MEFSHSEMDEEKFSRIASGALPEVLAVGCGGAGCNTVSRIARGGVEGAETTAVNTDAQDLLHSEAERKTLIGREITEGLGAGSDPKKGRMAAEEDRDVLEELLSGFELTFLTYGLGGGTGTGAGPVLAEISRITGSLTVAVVTLPFASEGKRRNRNASKGLSEIRGAADTTIVIPDDKLLEIAPDLSLDEAFELADRVLMDTIAGITELVTEPGLINLDFGDVRAIFGDGDTGSVGFGESAGDGRAREAAQEALENPLLDVEVDKARRALISVAGGPNMSLGEAEILAGTVTEKLDEDAHVAWGARISDDRKDTIKAMVIASKAEVPEIEPEEVGESQELDLERL